MLAISILVVNHDWTLTSSMCQWFEYHLPSLLSWLELLHDLYLLVNSSGVSQRQGEIDSNVVISKQSTQVKRRRRQEYHRSCCLDKYYQWSNMTQMTRRVLMYIDNTWNWVWQMCSTKDSKTASQPLYLRKDTWRKCHKHATCRRYAQHSWRRCYRSADLRFFTQNAWPHGRILICHPPI